MVEVTFTVSPRVRHIAAHSPEDMPPIEYFRQLYFGSELDLPSDFEQLWETITLESLDLPSGEKAIVSLQLPQKFIIVFDPVTHSAQFIDVKGEADEGTADIQPDLRNDARATRDDGDASRSVAAFA